MILSFDQRPDATVDEKIRSLMESVQMAFNAIDGGTITGSISSDCVKLIKIDGSQITGQIDGNYVFVKNLDARSVIAEEGWIDKLMVQTGLLSHEGTIFELDAIQVNAANIKAGTIDVERLVVTDATTGKKHMVTWNETTQQWDAAYLDGNAIADNTLAAGKIVASSITTREITVENLVGTGGWINLRNGTFSYANATTNKGITWDGTALDIKADSILLGAASEDLTATLSLKANKATLTSEINATADTIKIDANKLDITGVITAINGDSTTTIDGGKIAADSIEANALKIGGVITAINNDTTTTISGGKIDATTLVLSKIENSSTNYAQVTADGLEIVKSTSVALFGDSVRVGKTNQTHITITPTGTAAGIAFKTNGRISTGLILAEFGMNTDTGYTTEGWPEAAWYTLGYRTGTKGYYSTVVGYGCVSSHDASFAGGVNTTAYGPYSFAYGNGCRTGYSGNSSIHPGTAGNNGWASVALGSHCIAQEDVQIVVGAYNSTSSDLFVVGNGSSHGRSNALTVNWAGELWVKGSITSNNLAYGQSSWVTVASNGTSTVTISFGKTMDYAPFVVATLSTGDNSTGFIGNVVSQSVTKTGCTFYIANRGTAAHSVSVHWIAIV